LAQSEGKAGKGHKKTYRKPRIAKDYDVSREVILLIRSRYGIICLDTDEEERAEALRIHDSQHFFFKQFRACNKRWSMKTKSPCIEWQYILSIALFLTFCCACATPTPKKEMSLEEAKQVTVSMGDAPPFVPPPRRIDDITG
jgi:hypothetical protein